MPALALIAIVVAGLLASQRPQQRPPASPVAQYEPEAAEGLPESLAPGGGGGSGELAATLPVWAPGAVIVGASLDAGVKQGVSPESEAPAEPLHTAAAAPGTAPAAGAPRVQRTAPGLMSLLPVQQEATARGPKLPTPLATLGLPSWAQPVAPGPPWVTPAEAAGGVVPYEHPTSTGGFVRVGHRG